MKCKPCYWVLCHRHGKESFLLFFNTCTCIPRILLWRIQCGRGVLWIAYSKSHREGTITSCISHTSILPRFHGEAYSIITRICQLSWINRKTSYLPALLSYCFSRSFTSKSVLGHRHSPNVLLFTITLQCYNRRIRLHPITGIPCYSILDTKVSQPSDRWSCHGAARPSPRALEERYERRDKWAQIYGPSSGCLLGPVTARRLSPSASPPGKQGHTEHFNGTRINLLRGGRFW